MELSERLLALRPEQRRHAATLALWRLRAPLLAMELDPDWGIDPVVLEALFQAAASAPDRESDRAYREALTELCAAPLFSSEVDPETVELVQLETIASLLTFGEALTAGGIDEIEQVVERPRSLADHLDCVVANAFYAHPAEQARQHYVDSLDPSVGRYGLGYLGSRNLLAEFTCHEALPTLPTGQGLLATPAGRALLSLCEEVGAELVATLWWIRTTRH
ncbi:hypothetical protein [Streptacidiphilus rugosus]|uniref:hypothetical protein n=1 Tax=Streptacidiphilus rugosus TaxID=405783 RepID=UPI00056AB02A|nr:hypothetical protein [Streptacidiphilus rugosus]